VGGLFHARGGSIWSLASTIASPDRSADLGVSSRQGRTQLSVVDNAQAFVRGGNASPWHLRGSSVEPVPTARIPHGVLRRLNRQLYRAFQSPWHCPEVSGAKPARSTTGVSLILPRPVLEDLSSVECGSLDFVPTVFEAIDTVCSLNREAHLCSKRRSR
jgi:hypothetical protein